MLDNVAEMPSVGFFPSSGASERAALPQMLPTVISRIPPIPKIERRHGPLTARRLRGFYAMLVAVFLIGLAPVLLGLSPAWKALGLGLIFPGGGFLFAGGVVGVAFALLSVAAFAIIMFFWWARGPVLAPPAALLATAGLSALYIGQRQGVPAMEWLVPGGTALLYAFTARGKAVDFARAQKRGEALNAEITKAQPLLRDYPVQAAEEMPEPQIREYRRMLDLALQPVESWNGFPMNDRWQDGALRYQICTMSWNLALGQYRQMPAFHGYLNQAQENLIRKHIHRNTWSYWYWESLWGNFKADKNPVHLDNIMLSGFLGVSLGLFETASGTSPFAAPGSLTFRWDDKTAFPYSHSSLLEEVVKNSKRYDIGWFPCEPRWIYSMCNLVGRTSLGLHDARHGTDYVEQVGERFEKTMNEEMMMPDGRIKVCTSSLFGFQVPSLSGLFGETWGIRFLTPHAPEQAERLWQILKKDFISRNDDGSLQFKLLPLGWDTRKPADFSKWPDLNPMMMTMWAAQEMGDDEIAEAAAKSMDAGYGEGLAASMSWGGRNTMRDMVNKGLPKAWAEGPVLDEAPYPDVIVARAVSDGAALNLVLRPGGEDVQAKLGVKRLRPNRAYRVVQTGESVTADAQGRAEFIAKIEGRSQIDLVPVS